MAGNVDNFDEVSFSEWSLFPGSSYPLLLGHSHAQLFLYSAVHLDSQSYVLISYKLW